MKKTIFLILLIAVSIMMAAKTGYSIPMEHAEAINASTEGNGQEGSSLIIFFCVSSILLMLMSNILFIRRIKNKFSSFQDVIILSPIASSIFSFVVAASFTIACFPGALAFLSGFFADGYIIKKKKSIALYAMSSMAFYATMVILMFQV